MADKRPFIPTEWIKEIETANKLKSLADEVERMQDFLDFVLESNQSDYEEIMIRAYQIKEDIGE